MQLNRLTEALAKDKGKGADLKQLRSGVIGTWSAMVDAMMMARAVNDTDLSQEILETTRDWIQHEA
nr:hypothetical protein [uncultured Cohaesibacter sp.]